MNLVDTHCHIHDTKYGFITDTVIANAVQAGVSKMICVGTDLKDSEQAIKFVQNRHNCWASIGLHPHEGSLYASDQDALKKFAGLAVRPKVVAIGETGLDYYYNHSPKDVQKTMLHFQLDLAKKHDLPLIFHVRDAFDDFWPIFDEYKGIRGVLHSFTASRKVMDQALKRGLFMGLNGIMTFTKDPEQLAMAKAMPLEKMLLETDAPFLTPTPYRGTICEPKHVRDIGEFLAKIRDETLEKLAKQTSLNAKKLFNI